MRQYNVFQAIYSSFYSKNLYRDVATNWGGKAFLYLLLLVALSWIYATFLIQISLNHSYNINADKIVAQIPLLTIKDGKLSTPDKHPYIINDPSSNQPIAIIDTTGQYITLSEAHTKVLVTQTQVITQSNPNEIKTSVIPNNLNFVIDPVVANQFIKKYLGYSWLFVFTFLVLATFIYRILQALLYGLIGKIFSAMGGYKVSYGQIVQIMLIAITPVIIVSTLIDALNITIPHFSLYCFVLALLYLFFGIIANKK